MSSSVLREESMGGGGEVNQGVKWGRGLLGHQTGVRLVDGRGGGGGFGGIAFLGDRGIRIGRGGSRGRGVMPNRHNNDGADIVF